MFCSIDFLSLLLSLMCWDLREFNLLVFKATPRGGKKQKTVFCHLKWAQPI